ncbi:response regulator [Paenibacillus tuaregi]|uniref:response regulator n=1 Tax=Paenibacillus tuaregi TaxID=1816681 RepID=UPI0008389753|nr:response regulator [Paenibacillus tuaregi]
MKAVLIDDEKPALLQLERLLLGDGRVNVLERFTSVQEGLDFLRHEKVDVVFLDIGMPEMNGLEAGEYIQQLNPSIRIVYITAYSQYALEAFELYALDYVLKPVMPERLVKTIDRLEAVMSPVPERAQPAEDTGIFRIQLFKRLVLPDIHALDGKKLRLRTAKAQELLAYLLNLDGEWASKDRILEAVWQGYPLDKSITHLHTAIYQIRKLLRDLGADAEIEYAHENYRLKKGKVSTDVEQFELKLERLGEAGGQKHREIAEQAAALYRGGYLEEHDYEWAKSRRAELDRKYIELVLDLAKYELGCGQASKAVRRLVIIAEMDPYSDRISRLLIEAYGGLEEYTELRTYYEQFRSLLQEDLGLNPEEETRRRYAHWVEMMRK